MAAQVADGREILVGRRHVDVRAVVLQTEEHYRLVARPFEIELQLGVLVARAEGADGGLSPLDGAAVEVERLTEALRPQLAEPVGRRRESLAVRHQDDDRLPMAGGELPEEATQGEGRVGERR